MALHGIAYLTFAAALLLLARLPLGGTRGRTVVLLAASWFFYWTWSPGFLALLVGTSLFNFAWCALLRRRNSGRLLAIGIAVDIGLLVGFKSAFGALEVVGISFYTFQAVSALIDTWRGFSERPTVVEFCLFMAFWPTILSGPICRLPEMLPQYRVLRPARWSQVSEGGRRILVGLFQKLVVAETLLRGIGPEGGLEALGRAAPATPGMLDAWTLAVGWGLYIYFDFCGYSNIAIGSGRLFGLTLRENFNRPFLATSPADFWSRWHMSLSSWIRDYVFFPLAALRRARLWRYAVLVLSMVVFGLWHALQLNFLLWGLYQGLLLVAHRRFEAFWKRLPAAAGAGLTFLLVSFSWPLFVGLPITSALLIPGAGAAGRLPASFVLLVGGTLAVYLSYELLRHRLGRLPAASPWSARLRLAAPAYYATMALWVVIWSETSSPFVYVRF